MLTLTEAEFFGRYGDPGRVPAGVYLTALERRVLVALCRHVGARVCVEFGVQDGSTAACVMDHCPEIGRYLGIDLPDGARPALAGQLREVPLRPGAAALGRKGFAVRLQDSRRLAAGDLPPADFVFVDGGHDGPTVAHDTALALEATAERRSVVVWHDYNDRPEIGVRAVLDGLDRALDGLTRVEGTWLVFRVAEGMHACGARGDVSPRTPTGMGVPAGQPPAAAPGAAGTPVAGACGRPETAEAAAWRADPRKPRALAVAHGSRRFYRGVRSYFAYGDEWYTPPEIMQGLGAFALDPCAGPMRFAARNVVQPDDGLAMEWTGRVWLNPPYAQIEDWTERFVAHGNGIALVNNRTETQWWQRRVDRADGVLFVRGRLKFGNPSRKARNATTGSVLVAMGTGNVEALAASGIPGVLLRRATAAGADAAGLAALPPASAASGARCADRGSGGSPCPRPSETSASASGRAAA